MSMSFQVRPARLLAAVLLFAALLALAACDSAEERAQKHYEAGMALLEKGDVDRALVEFRNVFDLNGQHKEARLAYARIQRERGNLGDAYGQYRLSAEQYPDEIESRRALAEMATEAGNWEEAERNGRAAAKLAPDDLAVRAVIATLDYRAALLAKDLEAAAAAVEVARATAEEMPDNAIARRVVIDWDSKNGEPGAAIKEIDAALAADPMQYDLHLMKLRILGEMDDRAGIRAALETMVKLFPEDEQVRQFMIGWYVQSGDTAAAESFMRKLAEEAGTDPGPWLTLVQYLAKSEGPEAAGAELDRLIADPAMPADSVTLFTAAKAGLMFDAGDRTGAIAAVEAVLKDAAPSEGINKVKLALAQMLIATGNPVGARARVEEVLSDDGTNVDALKMRAAFLIDEDRPGDAIVALRTALDQNPRDVTILTLMGRAHERDGSRDLAGERYALAVEVSGRAPAESLRYAMFLAADDRLDNALAVVEESLRVNPADLDLLRTQAELQIRKKAWDDAEATVRRIAALGSEAAKPAADALRARLLFAQNRLDETADFLQSLVAEGKAGFGGVASVVQARMRNGEIEAASEYLDGKLAENPDDPDLRLLRASIDTVLDRPAEAEAAFQKLIEERPDDERPVRGLYGLYMKQGEPAKAEAVLGAALKAIPASFTLQMMKAGNLERAGDFEGAIAVYETLYSQNSANPIVANNLASTITTYRDDPESLNRAYAIARRLRGMEVPAFQDTYGWIAYRRGDYPEALASLEPAAAGLPQDPLVQFHLGMVYVALERPADARAALERALEIAGDSPLPQFETARKTLADLPPGE